MKCLDGVTYLWDSKVCKTSACDQKSRFEPVSSGGKFSPATEWSWMESKNLVSARQRRLALTFQVCCKKCRFVNIHYLLCWDIGSNTNNINKMIFFVVRMFFMNVTLYVGDVILSCNHHGSCFHWLSLPTKRIDVQITLCKPASSSIEFFRIGVLLATYSNS